MANRKRELQNGDLAGEDLFLQRAAETGNDLGGANLNLGQLPEHQIGGVHCEREEGGRQANPTRRLWAGEANLDGREGMENRGGDETIQRRNSGGGKRPLLGENDRRRILRRIGGLDANRRDFNRLWERTIDQQWH